MDKPVDELMNWKKGFGSFEAFSVTDHQQKEEILHELVRRLKGNYPFFHPSYAGQMLKPPAEIAREAYTLATHINPNNHALDGGPPTSEMEKEIIAEFARFFGYENQYLGHLTSNGTIANLEALYVAREIHPSKGVAYSTQAHYTHQRMCKVLGMPSYALDFQGDVNTIKEQLIDGNVGTLVVTLGTTGRGRVEDLDKMLELAKSAGIRVHVDAAYGGYFHLLAKAGLLDKKSWQRLSEVDSITIDPHKHGLQPYGCGCILFKDPVVGQFYKHDSPYTYFSSDELHLGEISLECSRAGAAAAALWATMQLYPLKEQGKMHAILEACLKAADRFAKEISVSDYFDLLEQPQLDIVCYYPIVGSGLSSQISKVSRGIFKAGMESNPKQQLHVSLFTVKKDEAPIKGVEWDTDELVILRSVLMKPEHLDFVPELISRLNRLYKKTIETL